MKSFKYFLITLIVFILPLFLINYASSQEEMGLNEATLVITARDSDGDFIPNINLEVLEEIYDIDGNSRPGGVVASGKIDPITGMFVKEFKDKNLMVDLTGKTYVLRMWEKNKTSGSFYFYGDAVLIGGQSVEVSETLSAIDVVIRDTQGTLLKNQKFNLYSQREDADSDPIKEKQDLIGSFDTSNEGEIVTYVPDGSRAIDGEGSDYYIFEMQGPEGGTYIKYDIRISDGSTRNLEYILSDTELLLKNADNVPYPGGTKIEFYHQEYDADDELILGDKIKDLYTDDDGRIIFIYPEGIYAARISGPNEQYQKFWNIEINDEEREVYYLKTEEQWEAIDETCDLSSKISLITMDLNGNHIPGLHFVFYEEKLDVNGIKTYGDKLVDGVIGNLGEGVVNVNPNPLKKYALKIYDQHATVGDFWDYDGLQFSCGEDAYIEKNIPSLKIIFRGANYELIKNQSFSIYTQKHDADGNPIKEKKDLVSSKLNTGEKGEYKIYLAPDHLYDSEKRGTYVLSVSRNKIAFNEYDIIIDPFKDQTLEYVFSNLLVRYRNGFGQVVPSKDIFLQEAGKSAAGEYILVKSLKTQKTDASGVASFEYPQGRYALVIKD
jgi:hypothetical protein